MLRWYTSVGASVGREPRSLFGYIGELAHLSGWSVKFTPETICEKQAQTS